MNPLLTLAIVSLLLGGCYASNTPDAGTDGHVASDAGGDGGPPDLDAFGVDAFDPCTVHGADRCGVAGCPAEHHCRASGTQCVMDVQLCLPAVECTFQTSPDAGAAPATSCSNGLPCLFVGVGTPAPGELGHCAPADVCLASDAEIGGHRCYWGDGTEVTSVPPEVCTTFTDGQGVACGAGCPMGDLLGVCFNAGFYGQCAGTSNGRGYGICATWGTLCNGADPITDWSGCASAIGTPCACMRPIQAAPTTSQAFGWFVPLDACREYQGTFPGEIDCIPQP